ncbi:hypothetical protein KCU89_g79, partial [Aureobasidium melanogenum]
MSRLKIWPMGTPQCALRWIVYILCGSNKISTQQSALHAAITESRSAARKATVQAVHHRSMGIFAQVSDTEIRRLGGVRQNVPPEVDTASLQFARYFRPIQCCIVNAGLRVSTCYGNGQYGRCLIASIVYTHSNRDVLEY